MMRLAAGVLVMLLLGAFPTGAAAGCTTPDCSGLKNLSAVKVVVDGLPDALKNSGLTRKEIVKAVGAILQDKLDPLKISETAEPYIYVKLAGANYKSGGGAPGKAVYVRVSLEEFASSKKAGAKDYRSMNIVDWEAGELIVAPADKFKEKLISAIEKAIGDFSEDWYAVNPDK